MSILYTFTNPAELRENHSPPHQKAAEKNPVLAKAPGVTFQYWEICAVL